MPFNYSNQPPIDYLNPAPVYGRQVNMSSFPDRVDVLIIGAGPAGLMAANALSSFGINVRIIDQRPVSVVAGQADGIQPRTTEVLQSYGLAKRLLTEGNQMWEHSFWTNDTDGKLKRTHRSRNVRIPGARYPFEITLHQGAIENIFIDAMSTRGLIIDRPTTVCDWRILTTLETEDDYRIQVTLRHLDDNNDIQGDRSNSKQADSFTLDNQKIKMKETVIYAKYIIGCDGAHSWVRKRLGFTMVGDNTDDVWGVIDSPLESNFPDLRNRTMIRSHHGICRIVPREGDLVRLYIQLPKIESNHTDERINRSNITKEILMESARKIFSPFTVNWPSVHWWAIYITGQRYATNFVDKEVRIFIAGDACHTHSPKAGQGMNAAMNDAHNLAWKLAMVIKGLAHPTLLHTYELERHNFAKQLIMTDQEFSSLFSNRLTRTAEEESHAYTELREAFDRFSGFFSGITVQYLPSMITAEPLENQALARGIPIGRSFLSCIVVRYVDARPFHLHDHMPSDLRFRILIFAGDCRLASQLKRIEESVNEIEALAKTYTPAHAAFDEIFDFITISSIPHGCYEKEVLPSFIIKNKWKLFCDEVAIDGSGGSAYDFYNINKDTGALVVVRPDGYAAEISDVSKEGVAMIAGYFENIFIARN